MSQSLTISNTQVIGNQAPRYPDLARGGLTFKRAKRETDAGEQVGWDV